MTAKHIVADLCTKLDRLIHAVSDDPVLAAGLQRERARLHIALESLQGSAADRQQANLSLKPRTAPPTKSRVRQPQSPANLRQLRRCRLAVRAACYSALAAELLDGRRFDVLLLLCQRAVNQSHHQLASCSSLSDSGGAASGVLTTGSTGALCTGASARRYRCSSSTIRACSWRIASSRRFRNPSTKIVNISTPGCAPT